MTANLRHGLSKGFCQMFRLVFVVSALFAVAVGPVAAKVVQAQTVQDTGSKAALEGLFASLKAAKGEAEARGIAAQIWRMWFLTENGAVQHLMTRVQSARRAGLLKEALTELNKIIELAPEYAEGWNQRATIYFMMGRDAESVADIQQVLRREPRHFGALAGLGLIHMRAKNWKSAIASFERALQLHPFLGERAFIPELKKKLKGQPL